MNINVMDYKTSAMVEGVITGYKLLGQPIPTELTQRLKELKEKEERERIAVEQQMAAGASNEPDFVDSEQPIYDTLVKYARFKPDEEKKKCVFDTVNFLLQDGDDAKQPGLLLGRIQCGKTDTFVKIMALAMDRKIDVCIVLTKGTNALADQTVSRMEADFAPFRWDGRISRRPIVQIFDIMQIKNCGISTADVNKNKIIIICKKEDDNLKHLKNLFEHLQPRLKEKNILVIDDEADFASWNYMLKPGAVNLAVITRLIHEFIQIPQYCRYLQVTATPYSLYLQPNDVIELDEDGCVRPMRPRFTTIVPTHDDYVGGDHYFIKSTDDQSMYSFLFHPISNKCMTVMKNKNAKYINNMVTSENIFDFRYAIMSYLMATVIRKIQESETIDYRSSCLIHLEVSTKKQVWQEELVLDLVNKIKDAYINGHTEFFDSLFDAIYSDFEKSNKAAREYDGLNVPPMPSKADVKNIFVESLNEIEAKEIVHVVNSDRGVKDLLDSRSGQLKLTALFNIFIGGSILDRGITIDRMLSFFYGRTPSTFQQDTVLQHMRLYGSRSKADMAVTRLHTTNELYLILAKMNDLDNQLREWLINTDNNPDVKATFVGYEPGSGIIPCAKGKIIVSDTTTLVSNQRITTCGFQTGSKTQISAIVKGIDDVLKQQPNYIEDEFFKIDKKVVYGILNKIRSTYVYDSLPDGYMGNYGMEWNPDDMIGCIEYTTDDKKSDKIFCMVRTNMNMSRLRDNGKFIDAPDTGSTDLAKARAVAVDLPALMLFRENGLKEKGWRDTPFYWPVLVTPQKIKPAIFTIDGFVPNVLKINVTTEDLLDGIDVKDVLNLPLVRYDLLEDVVEGKLNTKKCPISDGTGSTYLEMSITGREYLLNKNNVSNHKCLDAGIHTYNKGKFPFVVKDYKYMLLKARHDNSITYALCKIDEHNPYKIVPGIETDSDKLLYPTGKQIEVEYDNCVTWVLEYNISFMRKQEFTYE